MGFPVLDNQGQTIPIVLDPSAPNELEVSSNGEVFIDGNRLAQLNMVNFNNLEQLEKLQDQIFTTNQIEQPVVNAQIQQGAIEIEQCKCYAFDDRHDRSSTHV
jgi:flagellar basal body rod protein FlgG